jgi:hypothetical protein
MTKKQRQHPSLVSLPETEKKIVEEFVDIFNKHRSLGVIRLVEAARISFEHVMADRRRQEERKKYVTKSKS